MIAEAELRCSTLLFPFIPWSICSLTASTRATASTAPQAWKVLLPKPHQHAFRNATLVICGVGEWAETLLKLAHLAYHT
jgi:hypothetical protein